MGGERERERLGEEERVRRERGGDGARALLLNPALFGWAVMGPCGWPTGKWAVNEQESYRAVAVLLRKLFSFLCSS